MKLSSLFYRAIKLFCFVGFVLLAWYAIEFCYVQAAEASTCTIYFHRDFSDVHKVASIKRVDKQSTILKTLYAPSNAAGTLAKYGTNENNHFVYFKNSSGNYRYFVFSKAQQKYPLGSMSVKNCQSQGHSVSKIKSLSGVTGNTLHLYLAYQAKPHSFKTNKLATCAHEGAEQCSVCKRERAIPATGKHVFKLVSKGGEKHQSVCKVCGLLGGIAFCAPNSRGNCMFCGAKLSKGSSIECNASKYIATSSKEVTYCGPISKTVTSIKVPAQIEYHGVCYKVTKIKSSCCAKLNKLKSVSLGDNIVNIGSKAFYACKKLKTLKCTSSVLKKIGSQAFRDCVRLKTVSFVSKKLSSLGTNSFKGCVSLKRFTYKSSSLSKSKLRKAGVLR